LIRNCKRKTCLVVWLAIAQSFGAHAIVPGLTLRPVEARSRSTAHIRHAAVLRGADAASRMVPACRVKASNADEPSHLPGRRGRTDRCRAFFIAYKATPTKGPLDCLMIGLADYVRMLDAASFPDAVRADSPAARPPAPLASLTIALCRRRC